MALYEVDAALRSVLLVGNRETSDGTDEISDVGASVEVRDY